MTQKGVIGPPCPHISRDISRYGGQGGGDRRGEVLFSIKKYIYIFWLKIGGAVIFINILLIKITRKRLEKGGVRQWHLANTALIDIYVYI